MTIRFHKLLTYTIALFCFVMGCDTKAYAQIFSVNSQQKTTQQLNIKDSVEALRMYQKSLQMRKLENYDSAVFFAQKAVSLSISAQSQKLIADALLLRSGLYLLTMYERDKIIKDLLQSADIYERLKDKAGISACSLQLGILNFEMQLYDEAEKYFSKCVNTAGDNLKLKNTAEYLLALSYSELHDFDKAKIYFSKAHNGFGKRGKDNMMQVETFEGKMYLNMRNYDKAIQQFKAVIDSYKDIEDNKMLAPVNTYLSTSYLRIKEYYKAIYYGRIAFNNSVNQGSMIIYLKEAYESLSEAYDKIGNADSAFFFLKNLSTIKDSISNNFILQRIADIKGRHDYEHQIENQKAAQMIKDASAAKELARHKQQRNFLITGLILIALFSLILIKQRNKVVREKKRSDEMLLNILPEDTANELKSTGKFRARKYNNATVLFTDFVGFTKISESLEPEELVKEIHDCFSAFDSIIEKYSLEKIKTIGDAYMAASGLSDIANDMAPSNAVNAAIEMQNYIHQRNAMAETKQKFSMRAGVHTGNVIAGIVGTKKFAYDIWGDTVNTASRLESCSEPGMVNISVNTYEYIKYSSIFSFINRGEIDAKGKGKIHMYFVNNINQT